MINLPEIIPASKAKAHFSKLLKRIREYHESFAITQRGKEEGVLMSHELAGLRSFRTSDYRIIYRIKEKQLIIIVVSIGHRREIYKKLRELIAKAK